MCSDSDYSSSLGTHPVPQGMVLFLPVTYLRLLPRGEAYGLIGLGRWGLTSSVGLRLSGERGVYQDHLLRLSQLPGAAQSLGT